MLLATLMLDAGLLLWFPGLILKKGYSLHAVIIVAAISAIIMAIRCLRAPPAVLLQAVGAFKAIGRDRHQDQRHFACRHLDPAAGLRAHRLAGRRGLGELAFLFYCRKLAAAMGGKRG